MSASGLYRVADPAVARYELYRGLGGADPDFDAAPLATFTALPFVTPVLADGTHRFVVRRRNRYGLLSQNTQATQIIVDSSVEYPRPPSPPSEVAATASSGGTVTIAARYADLADVVDDVSYAADTWLIYLTTDGSDPDPGADVPIEVAMAGLASGGGLGDGVVELSYVTAALPEATVVNAIVRTRRSGTPDTDSTNVDIVSAVATLLGPTAVDPADGFYGEADRQA